jgi:hypothetical protein
MGAKGGTQGCQIQHTKAGQNIPNNQKIYPQLQLQDPPKFTQIWILGLKKYHLATLVGLSIS